jgi:hypothetical protein
MVIELEKPITEEKVKKALAMIKKGNGPKRQKNLAKHFGKLKRGIDGLTYQKKIRNEWD